MKLKFGQIKNKNNPDKGKVLLSEPFLSDPDFERSVILLCEYNEQGAYGLTITNPLEGVLLHDIIDRVESSVEYPVYLGGPVEPDVLQFIHTIDTLPGCYKINDDLFIGGDFDYLIDLMNTNQIKEEHIKFFLGYSGWDEKQLNKEFEENTWVVSEVTSQQFFLSPPDRLWKEILQQMGGDFKMMSNFPKDPSLN